MPWFARRPTAVGSGTRQVNWVLDADIRGVLDTRDH